MTLWTTAYWRDPDTTYRVLLFSALASADEREADINDPWYKCRFVTRSGYDKLAPTFNNSRFHMPTGQSCGLASGEAWSKMTPLEKLPGEAGS